MQNAGNVFLYTPSPSNFNTYHHELKKRGYYIFNTDNLYKLNLYHKEITPDVLLFDFDKNTPPSFINSLANQFQNSPIPQIIISELPKAIIFHPSISHYLTHLEAKQNLLNILEAYSLGNTFHHILYINLKPYERPTFTNSARLKNYQIFEVHNINSALLYLKKNTPQIICINFLPALSKTKKLFSHPKTFYVENTQNIEEFEQFLH